MHVCTTDLLQGRIEEMLTYHQPFSLRVWYTEVLPCWWVAGGCGDGDAWGFRGDGGSAMPPVRSIRYASGERDGSMGPDLCLVA